MGEGFVAIIISGFFFYIYAGVEDEVSCFVVEDSNIPLASYMEGATDVSSNFSLLFLFYGIAFLIDCIRDVLCAIYYKNQSQSLITPLCMLSLVYVFYLVITVIHHVYRLRHAGSVCSGDYLEDES